MGELSRHIGRAHGAIVAERRQHRQGLGDRSRAAVAERQERRRVPIPKATPMSERRYLPTEPKTYVDDEGSCHSQHSPKDPPLYHVIRSSSSIPYIIRCPKSLSPDERQHLKTTPR